MRLRLLTLPLLLGVPTLSWADIEQDIANAITKDYNGAKQAFNTLVPYFAIATQHQNVSPAATLGGGIGGFDIGINTTGMRFDKAAVRKLTDNANSSLKVDTLLVPRLTLSAGLPIAPVEISATYTDLGDTFLKQLSGGIKYEMIEGGVAMPSVSVSYRYSDSKVLKVIDVTNQILALSISKGFGVGLSFTPYAGAGYAMTTAKLKASNQITTYRFNKEDSTSLLFAGISINIGIANISYQIDNMFDLTSHTIKTSLRF